MAMTGKASASALQIMEIERVTQVINLDARSSFI